MTPKEKAHELVDKYLTECFSTIPEYIPAPTIFAKHCALIVVNEILSILNSELGDPVEYWEDVKKEISNI